MCALNTSLFRIRAVIWWPFPKSYLIGILPKKSLFIGILPNLFVMFGHQACLWTWSIETGVISVAAAAAEGCKCKHVYFHSSKVCKLLQHHVVGSTILWRGVAASQIKFPLRKSPTYWMKGKVGERKWCWWLFVHRFNISLSGIVKIW